MKAELSDISQVKKALDIEIPQEVVEAEVNAIAKQFKKRTRVHGFRPGKAPIGVIKNRYKDDILSEVFHNLLPKHFADAVKQQELNVVHAPSYDQIDYDGEKPLHFKALFEVYPQLSVSNHSGIPVEEVSIEVTESDVDEALENIVEEHSEMTPVEEDRKIKANDFVEISFTGVIEGADEDSPHLSGEKALCEIGGPTTLKEFTEHLTGSKAGDETTFEVDYDDEHPDKNLAGKTAHFKVQIESIKEKHRPELDDEFAQTIGDFPTLDDLKTSVRKNLEENRQNQANQQIHEAILQWLEENNEFEVPDSLVEHQLQIRLQRLTRDLSQQGINPQRLDVDWNKIRADQHAQAVKDVRGSLILDHLAESENISVEQTEIDQEVETISVQMGRPMENVREILTKNDGFNRIEGQLRNKKILEMLQAKAKFMPPERTKEEPDPELNKTDSKLL